MLSKVHRLQKDKDFKKVFRFSRPAQAGNLAIRTAENRLKQSRFGFVISNKIEKRATRRNALKRRLRALARSLISRVKTGYDVIVIVRTGYKFPYDYSVISADFHEGLRKAGILNAE